MAVTEELSRAEVPVDRDALALRVATSSLGEVRSMTGAISKSGGSERREYSLTQRTHVHGSQLGEGAVPIVERLARSRGGSGIDQCGRVPSSRRACRTLRRWSNGRVVKLPSGEARTYLSIRRMAGRGEL
jgi:hypothetical protein